MSSTSVESRGSVLERIRAFRERNGILGAVHKAVDLVLAKVFRSSIHKVVWLELEAVASMACTDPRFTFRFLTADEVARYAEDPSYYIDPSLAVGVRSGREVCFAALEGDRLAAFGCYTLRYVPPQQAAGAAMSFPPDVAYMSYGFTHPDFRGARLHGYIMGLPLQALAESHGVRRFVSIVGWTNKASLKSCYRLGYQNVGTMITIGSKDGAIGIYPRTGKQLGVKFGRSAVPPVAESSEISTAVATVNA